MSYAARVAGLGVAVPKVAAYDTSRRGGGGIRQVAG